MPRGRPTHQVKELRLAVLRRDKHQCVRCHKSDTDVILAIVHIIHEAERPDMKFLPSNYVTLCDNCRPGITALPDADRQASCRVLLHKTLAASPSPLLARLALVFDQQGDNPQ